MYIPDATYRVQLHKEFDFSRLSALLPYLYELGISTLYISPVTRARAGSEHGYDVINPLEINPEIGTAEEWESITAFLKDHGMGWLQDIVPNNGGGFSRTYGKQTTEGPTEHECQFHPR